jgi:hypothetical protein
LAKEKYKGHPDAVKLATEEAIKTVNKTQGSATGELGPELFQRGFGRLVGTFKRIQISMLHLQYSLAKQAFNGLSAKDKRVALKQLVYINTMAFTFAGLSGLPVFGMAEMAAALLSSLLPDDEDGLPVNLRKSVMNSLDNGRMWVNGPLSSLLGLDIGGRTGVGFNGIFRPDEKLNSEIGPFLGALMTALGAPASIFTNVHRGMELWDQGQSMRGIETMMPAFIKNAMKGVRFMQEGARNTKGFTIAEDPNAWNVMMQMVGFAPEGISEIMNRAAIGQNAIRASQAKRQNILARAIVARNAGDMEEYNRLRTEEAAKYNKTKFGSANRIDSDTFNRSWSAWNTKATSPDTVHGFVIPKKWANEFRETSGL